jgi:hypothetical protein
LSVTVVVVIYLENRLGFVFQSSDLLPLLLADSACNGPRGPSSFFLKVAFATIRHGPESYAIDFSICMRMRTHALNPALFPKNLAKTLRAIPQPNLKRTNLLIPKMQTLSSDYRMRKNVSG